MGFTVEDKHLVTCLLVSSSNEYLTLTLMECLIPRNNTQEFCINQNIFHRDIKENVSGCFFFLNTVYIVII